MIFGKYVNGFYKKYFYYILLGLICLIVVDLVQILIPKLIGNLVNIFSNTTLSKEEVLNDFINGNINDVSSFAFFVTAMIVIGIIMFVGRIGWRYFLFKMGSKVSYDLRKQIFNKATELSTEFYQKEKIGSLMSLFNNDLESIQSCFTDGIVTTIDAFLFGPMVVVSMFINNWFLTIFAIIPLVLMMICCIISDKGMTLRYENQLKTYDKISEFTQESFSGLAVIRAYVKEINFMRTFTIKNNDNRITNQKYVRYSTVFNAMVELLINSIYVFVIFLGVYIIINYQNYKVGDLVEFIGYVGSVIWPFIAISFIIMSKAKGKAGLNVITKFLDTKSELVDVEKNNIKLQGKIEFKNTSFKYANSDNLALDNISLIINKGENIGVVGRTGSGKSTLVKILLKLYNIDEGELFFDDIDINNLSSKDIRDSIGYVSQNSFLFSTSIRDNVAFSNKDADIKDVENAAHFACLDDTIINFKDGYNTIIGEKGASLSGGQAQRLAIARAILKEPEILILDDSVSAVDSQTEKDLLKNIANERKNLTTIIVSSRVSVVKNLDKIIVLDQGKLIGYGTHSQLLDSCELYKDMVMLQKLKGEEQWMSN